VKLLKLVLRYPAFIFTLKIQGGKYYKDFYITNLPSFRYFHLLYKLIIPQIPMVTGYKKYSLWLTVVCGCTATTRREKCI